MQYQHLILNACISTMTVCIAGSEQVRTFTTELLQEFDSNQNSHLCLSFICFDFFARMLLRWLEFDEFRKLYTMYLADEMARNALQTRVKVRFRSEEELRALADERLMLQRRRQLKTELEARREANHAVRKQQKKNMANSNYLDCDGLVRRGKLATDEHKAENVPSIVTGGKDSGASQQRRKRRSDLRNKQKQRCPVKMPCQKSITITDVKTRVPQHDVIHPSFAGRAHAPKSTNFNTHPIFCGLDRIPQCIPQPVSAVRSLTSIYDFNDTRDKNMEMWRLFLSPPLCRGLMRQHHREWATAHDRSENIHPAFWGSLVASNAIFANESFTCPALFGYSFRQQSGGGGQPTRQSTAQTHLPFTSFKESTCAQVLKPCLICLGGQFGCPSCFGLPAGLDLHECSFMPGDTISKKCDSQNSLHTDLTTRESLVHDRCVRHSRVDVLIKSVPCGAAVKLTLVSDDTVSHLHHLFRASSAYGAESLTLIAVPVERGLIDMNLSSFSLPGPSEGKISLHRYGLNKTGARAVLFHGRHHLTWSMIGTFIKNNMSCGVWPVSFTHMPMSHLDHAPATLPGTDSVQKELFKILKVKKTIPV